MINLLSFSPKISILGINDYKLNQGHNEKDGINNFNNGSYGFPPRL